MGAYYDHVQEGVAETIKTKSTTLKISEDGQSVDEFTISDKN